ncbi:MAG: hypothetical protein WAM72_19615 [Xanthobacteraceae bacterium]|jgi:hypothetical protein
MSQDHFGKTTRRTFLGTATATAASLTAPVAAEAQGPDNPVGTTKLAEADTDVRAQLMSRAKAGDWTKPAAMAIPKEGYFTLEQGRYGPIFPKTPANYGFTLIAKIKPGREEAIRAYGKTIENAIAGNPSALAPLRLHYLRWVLFNIGGETYFMYQGIFDTDFDKYTEDAVALFTSLGISTTFENLEGFPMDWKTNAPAFIKFVREHQCPSFLEYGEYPFVTADEIKKALKVKAALAGMLDQMQ